MKLKETYEKAGKELKERSKFNTTHPFWAKVRNVSASVAGGGSIALSVLPPGRARLIVGIITAVAGAIGGVSHFDKSKVSGNKFQLINSAIKLFTKKK